MQCPTCQDRSLDAVMTKEGVEIDRCERCNGVWLDKGEIYLFTKNSAKVAKKLHQARDSARPSRKTSPRTGQPMVEIDYPGGPKLDLCKASGGLWFDGGELLDFLEAEKTVRMDLDTSVLDGAGMSDEPFALPNLHLRSTLTLTGLYAMLGAVLIAAVEFTGVPLEIAVGIGVGIIVLQFLIGPFLMDLSLRWMYRMRWLTPEELPLHLRGFVDRVCAEQGIKVPRFGLIDDGAPQAFTYGHRPGNARIVLSRGILELLDSDESEAVVAHEIGHAVHWDMLLMTVAQMVPMVLYYLYRVLIRTRGSGKDNSAAARLAIAGGAYVLYMISEYVVLWFSRTREYHADRFAGTVTQKPGSLASALVKIAYGLAGEGKPATTEDEDEAEGRKRRPNMEAIGALGIFDGRAARALAVSSYGAESAGSGAVDKANLKGAMRWDLWNPWAKWYELHSTHPLVANRLRYLSNQAVSMGQEPYVVFDESRPESYWDEFIVDFGVHILPLVTLVGIPLAFFLASFGAARVDWNGLAGITLVALGAALFLRYLFVYRGTRFPEMSVATLLKKVKVSAVRPVPCTVKGTIIGRGVPGYILSEDFVMRDETGILFLDYRQPLAIWELLFGLLKAGDYDGAEVEAEGWYRRAPVPYLQIRRLKSAVGDRTSFVPACTMWGAVVLTLVGVGIILLQPF